MPTATDHAADRDTRERLIAAAERLFAARGVGAVSLRAVMTKAGTNVASVHYHFGSKEALVDAVVRSRMEAVSEGRDVLLADVAPGDARALARAFVQPVLDVARDGGRDWVQVIGQLLATDDPGLAPISESFFTRNAHFVDLLGRLDPPPTPAAIGFRLSQAMTLTLHVLGNVDHTRSLLSGDGPGWTEDDVVEQLLEVITAVLAGPRD